jgi:hypothetical protein
MAAPAFSSSVRVPGRRKTLVTTAGVTVSAVPGTQANASGVVELRPSPVIVDLETPTQLAVIGGIGKPCVRTLSAVDIPGRDDFAVRVDNSERNHGT